MYKVITVLALAVIGGIGYWFWSESQKPPPPPPPAAPVAARPPAPDAKPEPQIQHPIAGSGGRLPSLDESDKAMREGMGRLFGLKKLGEFFILEGIVRRVVATVDSLPREQVALDVWPVKPTRGEFQVDGDVETEGATLTISPKNAPRYESRVRLAESVDPKKLVEVYSTFYPLFQRAYQDLGYPKGYFNDRLIEVIDHLLAAPEPPRPVHLRRPGVRFDFADPDLRTRSAGQKILMRIGPVQAVRVKAVLKKIRRELVN